MSAGAGEIDGIPLRYRPVRSLQRPFDRTASFRFEKPVARRTTLVQAPAARSAVAQAPVAAAQRTAGATSARPAPPAATLTRPQLSQREVEVLLAWLRVDSKQTAAQELFISPATVSTHIARIRQKYADVGRAAPTKAQLVVRALQDGFIGLDDW